MQPVSSPGTPTPGDRPPSSPTSAIASSSSNAAAANSPLSFTQRATLDTLVVKLQALTSLSNNAIWTTLRQDIGLAPNQTLLGQHFTAAEQSLQNQLVQAQTQQSSARHPLLQRLTDLLPQGNNSQRVTQFLRQEFGHTELKALTQPQLQRVLTMLQTPPDAAPLSAASGKAPALATTLVQNALTNVATNAATTALLQRPLSSVEQNSLNQMVVRLSALLGEPTEKIWTSLTAMQHQPPGTPIPARHLPLLMQYLQTQTDLHHLLTTGNGRGDAPTTAATTLATTPATTTAAGNAAQPPMTATQSTLHTLFQPALEANERQLLLDYSQNRFNAGVQTPLTQPQLNELVTFLFAHRMQRASAGELTIQSLFPHPQPIANPLVAALPPALQAVFNKPLFWPIVSVCVVIFLLWVLF
ncbi:flagella biosynthesis regulator Flk [Candidatus Symbiopectobacterium sp. NZEC135]|uniref:flagella biosynthesis regulator Flk n=1 Tax=Candidatus Symbiopectobacterium sp. NZEC135 TaxID=2820471 RepID=UPI002226CEBE|nr:flagella biosynthesis regulator Flk [Candidatus Symbiopectobacterium sp. NZEC135]MCW2481436.1 flagella biosynthesis regulator Flk [Candidatus Symbiopectobacterium sp. NZEC135]